MRETSLCFLVPPNAFRSAYAFTFLRQSLLRSIRGDPGDGLRPLGGRAAGSHAGRGRVLALLTSAELQRDILDFHFIYRPPGAQEDLSIFYLDLERTPLYDELLVKRGTKIPSNEMVRDPERARAEKERILKVTAKAGPRRNVVLLPISRRQGLPRRSGAHLWRGMHFTLSVLLGMLSEALPHLLPTAPIPSRT